MFTCSFLSSLQVYRMETNPHKRPKLVTVAIYLLYICSLSDLWRVGSVAIDYNTYRTSALVSLCQSLLFIIFLTYKISQGRNWARITFLIVMSISIVLVHKSLNSILISKATIQILLQTIACILLFLKPSSDWFRLMKEANSNLLSKWY
jgi:hypothetical protein